MITIPPIYGEIKHVERAEYDKLIRSYVGKVKAIPGVISVIGLGSITIPGLSDIDLIVVVDDDKPPKWKEISLIEQSKGMLGCEVIFHDVFVIPLRIAHYIESFFYIDKIIIHYGEPIGGKLNFDQKVKLQKIITFDYCINRIDVFFGIIKLSKIDLRQILLFISTFRHSYKLLADLGVICNNEASNKIENINKLRKKAVNGGDIKEQVHTILEQGILVLIQAANQLAKKFEYTDVSKKIWVLGSKRIVISTKIIDFNKAFSFYSKLNPYIPITIYPSSTYAHVKFYKKLLKIPFTVEEEFNSSSLKELIKLRAGIVKEHWIFVSEYGFEKASGQGYIIHPKSTRRPFRSWSKYIILSLISIILNLVYAFYKKCDKS